MEMMRERERERGERDGNKKQWRDRTMKMKYLCNLLSCNAFDVTAMDDERLHLLLGQIMHANKMISKGSALVIVGTCSVAGLFSV